MLLSAACILAAFVTVMESSLAARGYVPSLAESYSLWQAQRRRADQLGKRALILVGNSRMQNDLDLDTLRKDTGLDPVQLAIGGASFFPVLKGLAEDPEITGTVLINFEADALAVSAQDDLGYAYQADYERHGHAPDFFQAEEWLEDELHFHLRSYANGTRPITALMQRILHGRYSQQFQSLGPDRQIRVDFSRIPSPKHYAMVRAGHEIGPPFTFDPATPDAQLKSSLQQAIAALHPPPTTQFDDDTRRTAAMVTAIVARGGRVIFVEQPRSGWVREVDEKRYPRQRFWQRFAATVPIALSYADVPALQTFICPDDSHLDEHDQARFTSALVTELHLWRAPSP
jgi:hypothetical protein